MNTPDKTRAKSNRATPIISVLALAAASIAAIGSINCATPPQRQYAPAPMQPDVDPIRNCAVKMIIQYNLTYTPRDANGIQDNFPALVIERLKSDGAADGNTFSIANGEQNNFTLVYTINNTNERYSGTVALSGWGWGYISTLNSGDYSFSNGPDTVNALTDKFYGFVHDGWHDTRKDSAR